MFQQQRKPQGIVPGVASQNESQAKEKLASYVYEYLVHAGAPKSAEMFKNEVLSQQNIGQQISAGDHPGFLHNWWCVFWDLYSAAPERRDKYEPSQEAKAFHEYGFVHSAIYAPPQGPGGPMMNPQMNGFPNGPPGAMGIPPNAEGMMPGYFGPQRGAPPQAGPSGQSNQSSPIQAGNRYVQHPGARSGAPTPSGVMGGPNFPPGAQGPPPHMFNNEQMRNMAAAQRMPPNARIPTNFPIRHMRPGQPYGTPQQHQFLESPSGTPGPFPPNPMMANGMCSTGSLMSSPGPGGGGGGGGHPGSIPMNPDGSDPRFMMMPGAAQYAMGQAHDTPTSSSAGGPTSVPGLNGSGGTGGGGGMPPNPTDTGPGSQLQNLLNGGGDSMEMKQSPAGSQHGNMNGGTPGAHTNPGSIQGGSQGGPASVAACHGQGPGSVHSQSGGPNSQQQQTAHQPSISEANSMDFQLSAPANAGGDEQEAEISKIKTSLLEDFASYS